MNTVCPCTHVIIVTVREGTKRNAAWKVTIVSTTRLTTFKVKVLVTLFRSKAFLLFPYYYLSYLTYRTGPA